MCREGGARVRTNVFVRDMDLAQHDHADGRRLEVVADGLPLFGGSQLAIDTTMVSLLRCSHQKMVKPWRRPADAKSERTLSLLEKRAGRVLSSWRQVGGRWSDETADFLCQLAWAKVRELPEDLQRDGRRAGLKRWQKLLGCAAAKSFALSLIDLASSGCGGVVPSVHEVICEARHSWVLLVCAPSVC